jgi:hypothetical protein
VYRDEAAIGYLPAPIKPWVAGTASTQLALSLAGAATLAWGLRRRKSGRVRDDVAAEGIAHGAVCLWTFFLQVSLSAWIWMLLPGLATVQFPWRFGAFQALSACVLVALAFPGTVRRPSEGPRWANVAVPAAILLLAALPALWLSSRLPGSWPQNFSREQAEHPRMRTWVMYEYIPSAVVPWREFARIAPNLPRAQLLEPGDLEVAHWSTHSRRIKVSTPSSNRLRVRTFAYPGWRLLVDGRPAMIHSDNPYFAIEIDLPAGSHTVELDFRSTTDRLVGASISIGSLGGLLAALLLGRRRRP